MKAAVSRMIDTLKIKSIQFIITASFTLIVVVMLFIGIVLYNKFSETAQENAHLNTEQIIDQVSFNLEYYLKGMADIFHQADAEIQQSDDMGSSKLIDQLQPILNTREDIVSLSLFTGEGELVTGSPLLEMRKNSKLTEQSWFKSAIENPNHLSFSLPHIQNLFKVPYKWVVSMSKGVQIKRNQETVNGVLLMDVNFKTIDDLFQRVSLGKKGYVYIIDESSGSIVYHPQQQLIYIGLKYENVEQALKFTFGRYTDHSTGEKRLITVKTVNNIGWKIIGVSYLDEIVSTQKDVSGFIIWLISFVILFLLLILAYMSLKISKPIKRLEKSMEQVEQGDFDIHVDVQGGDEVEQLSRRFNLMVSRIRQLMDQIIHEQEAKRKTELEVLQAQINPHFLYNTLNSIVRMVGSGKNDDVITTITSLSRLFRISLSRGKTIITIQEEIEHVRNYLIIQRMRFKNKFDFRIEAEEAVLTCLMLKLILQPIVENAIYHGIEYSVDRGYIHISASIMDGKILLQVKDNGVGMTPDLLEHIRQGHVVSEGGSGVGINNVRQRIRLHYGEPYGLEFESQLEAGTTVSIWMPLLREEDSV